MQSEFQYITPLTKKLLDKEEGLDVDFKADGIEPEDIVAFANSSLGGVILIGVAEVRDKLGRVKGQVIGTKIGDNEKLKIINKALDCSPPIQLSIVYENTADKPIIRVDIPSGPYRPYCTKKGIYKIRNDGRNQALTPDKLFEVFLEREYKSFIDKFKEATKELKDEVTDMAERLEFAQARMTNSLDDISSSADQAESNSSEAHSTTEDVYYKIVELEKKIEDIEIAIRESTERELLVLKHLGVEDPRMERLKNAIRRYIQTKLDEAKEAGRRPSRKKIIDAIESIIRSDGLTIERDVIEEIYEVTKG